MFPQEQETPTEELSGFVHPKYSQNDLMSNRKRLFDTSDMLDNETHKKQPPVRSTSYTKGDNRNFFNQDDDYGSPRCQKKENKNNYSPEQYQQDSELCNFQSFSKNYVTFDNQQNNEENKENQGFQHNKDQKKTQKPPQLEQMNLPKGTYADRYLLMMKKRRETSTNKQNQASKSGKKQSMFDEIRHQAVTKVQNRHY